MVCCVFAALSRCGSDRNPRRAPGAARHDGFRGAVCGGAGAAIITSDLDIYRSAQVLIREHGEDAALAAALQPDMTTLEVLTSVELVK